MVAGIDYDDTKKGPILEVMHVNGTTKICNPTANYPKNLIRISGGSFLKNNLIVVCGGCKPVNEKNLPTSACYSMSNDLKWTHFTNLTTKKWGIASVIVKNGLWVTGKGFKFKY